MSEKVPIGEKVLMKGNEAIGEAAVQAGCMGYFGYPITPQNELTAYMSKRMLEEGRVFIQSESEIAAINMCFGAATVGNRSMAQVSWVRVCPAGICPGQRTMRGTRIPPS